MNINIGCKADRGGSEDNRPHCNYDRDGSLSGDLRLLFKENEILEPNNTSNYRVAKKKVESIFDTLAVKKKRHFSTH